VDVFLLIHEYYPDLDDKWLSRITAPFFTKIWNQEQEKKDFLNDPWREHERERGEQLDEHME
jgi:hypothetical protein